MAPTSPSNRSARASASADADGAAGTCGDAAVATPAVAVDAAPNAMISPSAVTANN